MADPYTPYDDFHYPKEEPAQMAASTLPTVVSTTAGFNEATVRLGNTGETKTVCVGDTLADKIGVWAVRAIFASGGGPTVVMEQDFDRWGMLVFAQVGKNESALKAGGLVLRKSVGRYGMLCVCYNIREKNTPTFTV